MFYEIDQIEFLLILIFFKIYFYNLCDYNFITFCFFLLELLQQYYNKTIS